MPERGVEFNAAPIPPAEYLMRRSYNPNDAQIPGAVVREYRCEYGCPAIQAQNLSGKERCESSYSHALPGKFHVYSVEVPLVKTNGERWS